MTKPLLLFTSYADEDEDHLRQLEKFLKPLQRLGLIAPWSRQNLVAGSDRQRQIDEKLDRADLILLLITSDFLASDSCHAEMERALNRHKKGQSYVIPILVKTVPYELTPFATVVPLPRNGVAVTARLNQDEAWQEIFRALHDIVKQLQPAALGEPMVIGLRADDFQPARDACSDASRGYKLASGAYRAVPGSGVIISDSCQTGVAGTELETTRIIRSDDMGNITVYSADGATVIGTGLVRHNQGRLTSGPATISNGVCIYTVNYEVDFIITTDDAFAMTVTQWRSNSMSAVGQTCKQPPICKVTYRVACHLDTMGRSRRSSRFRREPGFPGS